MQSILWLKEMWKADCNECGWLPIAFQNEKIMNHFIEKVSMFIIVDTQHLRMSIFLSAATRLWWCNWHACNLVLYLEKKMEEGTWKCKERGVRWMYFTFNLVPLGWYVQGNSIKWGPFEESRSYKSITRTYLWDPNVNTLPLIVVSKMDWILIVLGQSAHKSSWSLHLNHSSP